MRHVLLSRRVCNYFREEKGVCKSRGQAGLKATWRASLLYRSVSFGQELRGLRKYV